MTEIIRTGIRWALALGFAIVALAIPTAQPAKAQFNGCSFGGFGAHIAGLAIPDGSPAGFGAAGQTAGISAGCDLKLDRIVVGGEISYAWVYGGLGDLGIDNDLTIMGRAGYLFTPTTLFYFHGDWARISGGSDHIDGIKAGVGIEFKLSDTMPLFGDARWSHGWWDVPGVSGWDVTSDEFRFGVKWRLGPTDVVAKALK